MAKLAVCLLDFVFDSPVARESVDQCQRLLNEGLLEPGSLVAGDPFSSLPRYIDNPDFEAPPWVDEHQDARYTPSDPTWDEYWDSWIGPRHFESYELVIHPEQIETFKQKRSQLEQQIRSLEMLLKAFEDGAEALEKAHVFGVKAHNKFEQMAWRGVVDIHPLGKVYESQFKQ
jgi:hypothetical protein